MTVQMVDVNDVQQNGHAMFDLLRAVCPEHFYKSIDAGLGCSKSHPEGARLTKLLSMLGSNTRELQLLTKKACRH